MRSDTADGRRTNCVRDSSHACLILTQIARMLRDFRLLESSR